MKLIDRQLVLPVAIGLSLTGVGAALLYLIYKKDDDANDNRRTDMATSRQNEVEVKVPRQFVPVIIGRGGATIKDIQEKTETRMNFVTDDKDNPERICKIRGKPECVRLAEVMIENIIANQPIIEVYETYIPQRACGRIIGRGGEVVQHIQATSGAKVIVESSSSYNNPDSKRRLIIKGTAEHIAAALALIEEKVREENEIREKLDVSLSTRLPRGKISPRNTVVHTSDSQPDTADSLTPQVSEGLMEVYVSAVENPSQFWVQVVGPGSVALDKLVDEMTAYYNNEDNTELHELKTVTVGQTVAAKFSYDGRWYRAEVVAKLEDDQYEVYFVDYGDHQEVILEHMMELRTDFLSLRLQAIECSLANVKPRDGEWSLEACDRFAELSWMAQWKALTAKVRGYRERALARGSSRREGSPIPCVDLYDKADNKDINIGKELVTESIAEEDGSWSAASSTLSLTRRSNHEQPTSPRNGSSETPPPPASDAGLSEGNAPVGSSHAPTVPKKVGRKIAEIDQTTPKVLDSMETQPPPASDAGLSEGNAPVGSSHVPTVAKKVGRKIAEIDLTTPKKGIEIIDLVTPSKRADATSSFISSERNGGTDLRGNGSGDYFRNGRDTSNILASTEREHAPRKNIPPADYDSDLAKDSDELELG